VQTLDINYKKTSSLSLEAHRFVAEYPEMLRKEPVRHGDTIMVGDLEFHVLKSVTVRELAHHDRDPGGRARGLRIIVRQFDALLGQ